MLPQAGSAIALLLTLAYTLVYRNRRWSDPAKLRRQMAMHVHDSIAPFHRQPYLTARTVVVVAGFSAIVGQIVLLRELMVIFQGNELSVGIMLAAWLVWSACGSFLTSRLVQQRHPLIRRIAFLEIVCGAILPVAIWIPYMARAHWQSIPGELLSPAFVLAVSLFDLSIFCVSSGALFVLAVLFYESSYETTGQVAASSAYLLDALGSALGGIVASTLLLRYCNSFQIAFQIFLLNLLIAVSLVARLRTKGIAVLALVEAVLAIPVLIILGPQLQHTAQQQLWSGFQILDIRDSIYGKLTVVESNTMRTIYDNGSPIANIPDRASAEENVHYAMLQHPFPKRVLLIGGGASGSVSEALKYASLRRLDYVELDPTILSLFLKYAPPRDARDFSDPRVHVHYVDGRHFLIATQDLFDEIILCLPDPQTAQMNRFYTKEFFQLAKKRLAHNGVLALQLQSSEDFVNPDLADFLRCIHHTIEQVFPHIAILPGNPLHLFAASESTALTESPELLISRLQERKLNTQYVREYFLPYRMSPDRMSRIEQLLRARPDTPVNHDLRPVAYYFGIVLWNRQFKSGFAEFLKRAAVIPASSLFIGVLLLSALSCAGLLLLARPQKLQRASALWSMATTGFTLMSLQMSLLLTFQAIYGYLYHQLAILIGMFMAGIAVGTYLGMANRRTASHWSASQLAGINQGILALSSPLVLLVASATLRHAGPISTQWISQALFPALALATGIPGGYQFSVLAAICVRTREAHPGVGALYALDLAGGALGALLLAAFLIPVFGLWTTAWLTSFANVAPALLAFYAAHQAKLIAQH